MDILLLVLSAICIDALTDILDFFFFLTTFDEASFCLISFYTYFLVRPNKFIAYSVVTNLPLILSFLSATFFLLT